MMERLDFAPLDGITKVVFRRVWSQYFGGVDRYFIPFISPTDQHILTPRDRRELELSHGGAPAIPQIMTCRAADFLWAAEQMAELGFSEVNLNLGCPSGTVTAKGKGSGFLAKPEELDRFFEEVFSKAVLPISVKTRLGIAEAEEFPALLDIYNRYPIACLTIHARVKKEKYRGPVHLETFEQSLRNSRNPVCYNGDLRTVAEVRALEERFPDVTAVMIGRGAVADPALARKLRGGPAATREELMAFTEELFQAYQAFYGQADNAAQRMKEVWFYLIHLFEGGERLDKQMRRSRGPAAYVSIRSAIFAELPLRDHSEGNLI
ncbi:tRNA-dihydrouridine synthase family protein [Oscillibacter sp.]|uniref:tRNA dihydrouridine synthase n=1 Tax=Oscillibacter sp. TaxID=1945593 RepID=UPI0026235265|nr:tRNA-dihydrouridine synthase family protein [Oscillibacter sp.]MDD3347098.1 tRNA-dihydrouridine synthase family protein [Oscillibacter sp.]